MTATLNEALEASRPRVEATAGPAQRTLRSLRDERGYAAVEGPSDRPTLVRIQPWTTTTWWRRVTSGGGDQATYERTDAPGPALIITMDGERMRGDL